MIAEEILPHVILGLFLLIFFLAYLAMKDDSAGTKTTKEEQPVNRFGVVLLPSTRLYTDILLIISACISYFVFFFMKVFKLGNLTNQLLRVS